MFVFRILSLQKEYNSNNNKFGYNLTNGGESSTYIRTEEIKKKISNKLKGHTYNKGKKFSKDRIYNMIKAMQKLHSSGYILPTSKKCLIYDKKDNLLFEYDSINKASKDLKISSWVLINSSKYNKISKKYNIKAKITNE